MPVLLFVHLSWTTLDRRPMIGPGEARFLAGFLPAGVARHGAKPIATGIVADHVHLIAALPSTFDVPRLVKGLKGASARLVNRDMQTSSTGLRWARGYDARSVSPRSLAAAVAYTRTQNLHHPDRAIPGLEPGG
jgi:REP element-mobilizing transposase RayT